MERLSTIKLLLIWFVLISPPYLSFYKYAHTQEGVNPPDANAPAGEPPTGGSQQGEVIKREPEPPWYYYWPEKPLNPFGLSTLGNEGGATTFGKSIETPSNVLVNEQMEEQIPDEEKAGGVSDYTGVEGTMGEGESVSVEEAPGVVKKGPMYKWVDEKGVIRVTNDLGSVPPEYLDKIELDKGQ